MITLTPSTCRRLQQLPQPGESIWEADRRIIPISLKEGFQPECILWVDGSEGVVRSMEMVNPQTGPEALVRALLKAMEAPPAPSQPSRPKKIVVCDREIQFYLRGVLQDLDIDIEYRPQLPLIEHLFQQMAEEVTQQTPQIAPKYLTSLSKSAEKIWQVQPWQSLAEHQIISVQLNQWDIEKFYVSILGMLGEEYGILLYRSLDSLKQFRQALIDHNTMEDIESALFHQDCFFLTFELKPDSPLSDLAEEECILELLPWSEIEASFGVIHPLEGLRTTLYEREPVAMMVALEALHRFFKSTRNSLDTESFESLSQRYRISLPKTAEESKSSLLVKVETLPEVSLELDAMMNDLEEDEEEDEDFDGPLLQYDLIPDNALCRLDILRWETWESIREQIQFHPAAPDHIRGVGAGLPVAIVQTSKRNAKTLIRDLEAFDGLEGLGFNGGEDPYTEKTFDLGILQTGDGDLYLFDEFEINSTYQKNRQNWDDQCRKTQGYCGLLIAMGMRGESRGNPQPKDMLALFEAKFLSIEDLKLGILQKTQFLF
ncbi:hypothetical protein PN466_02165 [Roseofilum reptotaenium CS-1145]|uniref:Uncharacterized protein n=1 Tax=Roseofilum reptotaenium AO1-A TaxID=1925591 RepID=A0A1L9QPN0_9CYAN|nr:MULTISPECIES: hypothetical protein [Roseofilum]MBP0030296.1 hypothetical protein [Roseofilum sp. Guam]MDB9515762.1 hypothetical protein [Roseofilum reptotaenium CS-1145]OJJ24635.1 hypothetical protein BI308_15910 [Roseofilum reptotaenium AO1-A]